MTLEILLAKDAVKAAPIREMIEVSINSQLPFGIHVTEVSTLAEVINHSPNVNIIILGLHLTDAGPEEIIAVIPSLPEPVLVVTDIMDPEIHLRCRMAKAFVIDTNVSRYSDICTAITGLLSQSLINSIPPETP